VDPTLRFFASLLATVVLLLATVYTGYTKRLRLHFVCVAGSVSLLGASIWAALQLSAIYDIHSAGWITPLHLTLARITTLLYLLPLVTGLWTYRDRGQRKKHRAAAFLVLGLTVLTTITGAWMLLASERIG
jgi:hypothetical protein